MDIIFSMLIILFFCMFYYCDCAGDLTNQLTEKQGYKVLSIINLMFALSLLFMFAIFKI